MKDVVGLAKWLLERDIRAKNAVSFLAALLSVVAFYFASRHCQWFQELQGFGTSGVAVAIAVVFLIAFLGAWLIFSGIAACCQRTASCRRTQQEAEQRQQAIRDNLESLTSWQRRFLRRFIVEGRRQIPAFEIGQFAATWDFEMGVLIAKGIIKRHRGEVFEIHPLYHAYLMEH